MAGLETPSTWKKTDSVSLCHIRKYISTKHSTATHAVAAPQLTAAQQLQRFDWGNAPSEVAWCSFSEALELLQLHYPSWSLIGYVGSVWFTLLSEVSASPPAALAVTCV